jgi:hypothetical protein
LGAITSLIIGLFTLTSWNSIGGAGVPGFPDLVRKVLLYASIITSGVESLLLSGLGYYHVISRKWTMVGAGLFGTMFLVSLAALLFFGLI